MNNAIRAILFDLDGTLLDNAMNIFLPQYFRRLSARVAHIVPPDKFMPCLLQASQAMTANDGRATNKEVFAETFYPLVEQPREKMEAVFEDFYASDFPALQLYTRRKPAARRVIQKAFDQGYDVVIATNPLFPATAIEQRLAWAGIDGFPYKLVTSYENSRACKPNLLYYQHIIEHLERPAKACLVVGNEAADMVAARLGCATFLVPGPDTELDPTMPAPTCRGTLIDLETLLGTAD